MANLLLMKKFLLFLSVVLGLKAYSQSTYVWNNPGGGNYTVAANWSPNRTSPASDDILVFNDGGSYTISNVPTQTIGKLIFQNNTNVLFQAGASGNTLTIAGGTGTDFLVEAGSNWGIRGTNICTLLVATGANAEIYGGIGAGGAAHRFLAIDANSFVFKSGALCVATTNFAGNMFGNSGTLNTTIFEAGSEYICEAGANPFGFGPPSSKVIFQTNSKYTHRAALVAPATAGRTYAIFELDHPSFNTNLNGASPFTVQKFVVKQGNLKLGHSADVNVLEDIVILSGTSERTSTGKLNVGTHFVLNGGNFNYTGTGALTIGGNLEVQSASSTFNLNPTIASGTRNDIIGGDIINNGGTLSFNPVVTPLNYSLIFQSSTSTPQSFTNTGTLIFGPTVVVTLSDGDGYVLNSNITIGGILNLPTGGGKINGNGNTLTLGINDASPGFLIYTLGSTSSYIYNGKFRRWFKASATTNEVSGGFPLGISSDIQPCAVKMTTAPSTGGYITAEYITGYAGDLGLPLTVGAVNVNRVYGYGYYRVEADASLTGYVYTFRMVGTNYEGVGNYQELVLLKRADNTSPWTAPGMQGIPVGTNSQFSLELIGLNSFSEFIVGGNDVPNPLPIFFKQFVLQRFNHNNYLSWIIENPQEIQNFEIQKSYDAQEFFSLDKINVSNTRIYDYLDNSEPQTSKIFYRIKANLNDGRSAYSETLELNLTPQTNIQVYQNPLQNHLKLMVQSDVQEILKVQIYDLSGKKVLENSYDVQVGNQIFTIDTEKIASGLYVLHTQLNGQNYTSKILK